MEFWSRLTAIVLLSAFMALPANRSFADNTKAEVFSSCKEQMKKEFGEAEFSFNKLRRNEGNIAHAYGELTLSDGSKRAVRCTIHRGRFRGVDFRNANTSRAQGGFWSEERPAGAVYVPPAEPEAETDTTRNASTPEETATDQSAPEETATSSGDTEGETTETAAAPSDPANPEAPTTDAGTPASPETTETRPAETNTTESEDDGPRPVFKRVN